MNDEERLRSERLVEVYKARDEWEGDLIIGYLKNNGIDATFQGESSMPFDMAGMFKTTEEALVIFALERDAKRAAELVREFLGKPTDERVLEEEAAHKLHVDKETIRQLRGAVCEERRTFKFLGWLGVAFLGATALLWAIWPAWLKIAPPAPEFQWMMVIALALAAVFAGNWASRRM